MTGSFQRAAGTERGMTYEWICDECHQLFDQDDKHIVQGNRDLCLGCHGPVSIEDMTIHPPDGPFNLS
jgi:Doubled CXXCH motif (Paired_CXXCH_1)